MLLKEAAFLLSVAVEEVERMSTAVRLVPWRHANVAAIGISGAAIFAWSTNDSVAMVVDAFSLHHG